MTIYQEHIFILIGFRTVCLLFLCQEHGSFKGQENQDELVVEASRGLVCPNLTHQAWCPVEMKSHFEAWRHPDEVELTHRWVAKLATVAAGRSLVPSQMLGGPAGSWGIVNKDAGTKRAPLVSSPTDLLMFP